MIETFRRVEKKYLLNKEQYNNLLNEIKDKLNKDDYFYSEINNIYFDTDNYDLIVRSLEKPVYKEKVRLRSYGVPSLDDKVFFEIKKKYKGTVYKRRIHLPLKDVYTYLDKDVMVDNKNMQIFKEIDYCFKYYNLKPSCYIGYDRYSYYEKDNKEFRVTFDTNIRSRNNNLKLEKGRDGEKVIGDKYLMEVKCLESMPLWFVKAINKYQIYPVSFSKYGNVYKNMKGEV